ncbi:alpha-1,3/1,6-mannosyltransferase ALG2 isoform X1 [Dermacentor albipictus]|uniref:alpha-1,3/1,6-mannosyltransferase ALG2 isoform X1 n=2 Tax=Dermacentor albipictus TaxID=60249 RepID=UPI0038FCBCC5
MVRREMSDRRKGSSRGSSASGGGDSAQQQQVCLVHLDLGVGGAERLMVDVGLALRSKGNPVYIVTTHHDRNHCFPETLDDQFKVVVVGDWLPRSVLGRFYALCSYLRMMVAALYVVWFSDIHPDVIICDQVSACVPILRLCRNARVVFYCHFPDLMLSKPGGLLKRIYRWPINALEQWSTGFADSVLVNSHFTGRVFREVFPRLSNVQLRVLYPAASLSAVERPLEGTLDELGIDKPQGALFLSLNRFERKKNLALALHAVELASREVPIHLIVAGGYDPECRENVEHWDELVSLAEQLGVQQRVSFVRSPSESAKLLLLHTCRAVVYTPANEHFGIVPVEAMCMRRAVVACNSGGPTETVVHGETGLLCDPTPEAFAAALVRLARDRSLTQEMGARGRERAEQVFSWQRFVREVHEVAFGDNKHEHR